MYLSIPVLALQSLFRGEVLGFAAQEEYVCVTCALCGERNVAATYFSTPSQRELGYFCRILVAASSQAEYHETWT